MPGYQPRLFTDHVWVNGTDIHTYSKSTGLGVRVTEMRGWDDRPDIRDSRDLRMGQDGEYANNLYLGGRTISIAGAVHGSSWEDLQTRKRALAAVFVPSSTEVLLKVPDPATASPTGSYSTTGMTGYERVSCRVVEPIMFGDMIGSCAMTWQVVVRASDPRVYSDTETSTDSSTSGTAARTVSVNQAGTYDTNPTITVTGPTASTWSVAGGGDAAPLSLSFTNLTLSSTDSAVINVGDRTVDLYGYTIGRLKNTYPPTGLYPLNETSGTTADNAEGTAARDATYTGGFTLNQSGPASGMSSVTLNGTTGYISVPNQSALYSQYATFEMWVNFASLSGTQTLFDCLSSNKGVKFEFNGTTFVPSFGNGSGTSTSGAYTIYSALATGTWYRVVASFSKFSATVTMLNWWVRDSSGNDVHSGYGATATAVPSVQTTGGYRVGSSIAGTNWLNANVSSFAIYPDTTGTALTVPGSVLELPITPVNSSSAYSYLSAETSTWAMLGTESSGYTLTSTGLNTGSRLNVKYRDARL